MDEEIDPDGDSATSVLAQESSALLRVLAGQSPEVVTRLLSMAPRDAGQPAPTADAEAVRAMLEYFSSVDDEVQCCNFIQSMCLLCDIPFDLECRLMYASGRTITGCETDSPRVTVQTTPCSPSEPQPKQLRIDHWEQYGAAAKRLLLGRWQRLKQHLPRDVQLENVWVCPRTASRGRDRPDQTPGSVDRGGRTPEPDGVFGSLESRVTLDAFLQGSAGKVTVLTGQAGAGKTLLMSCLGQQWANSLGQIPSSFLFVLLEFRQLNLLLRPLSLSELLFQHFLPPEGGDIAKRAIVDYLLSNPEQSCWVLDGYDEFRHKLSRREPRGAPLDPEEPLPVEDLVAALLHRRILPESTVLATCRPRDLTDLDGVPDRVGQLVGWDHREIQEYVHDFFRMKGHSGMGAQAVDLLFSSRHLVTMSSLPALCNICCICLDHLLLEGDNADGAQREEGGDRGATAVANGREQLCIPATLTQVYLTVLSAFLSRHGGGGGGGGGRSDQETSTRFPHSLLRRHQSRLCELSGLAWRGLEDNRILFMDTEVSRDVLDFSLRTGILYQVELRRQDGTSPGAGGVSFIHLKVQEFFAALQFMTSDDVNDAQLKKRFSLKTRWTTKSDQRTVFTDSLHLFMCGLASPRCTPALVQLDRTSGATEVQNLVRTRQQLVLKLLKTWCNSNTLTGPKILELCRCVQETQDHRLARQVADARSTLELRNIWLQPTDMEALAFVVNSGSGHGIGLDFGACSMEPECLDVLSRCRNVRHLSFRSRKYDDKFAEKLSLSLPDFKTLRKLEFCGASLTAAGAAALASGLLKCPDITEINLSDNNLRDKGIKHVTEIFTKLQNLTSVTLGRNNTSLKAVDHLVEKMCLCSNIQMIHADETKTMSVTFCPSADSKDHKAKLAPAISLLNQKWSKTDMQKLARLLADGPTLSVVDLSGGQWDGDVLRTLTQLLPKFNVTEKIILNDSCSSVDGLVLLTALLSLCPTVTELHIRLQSPPKVSIMFSEESIQPATKRSKVLRVSCCNLQPANLERLWRSLGMSSGLTVLDLSCNSLGNRGLRKLLDFLPRLKRIQEINASRNNVTAEGVAMLAAALGAQRKLTQICISDGGRDQLFLKFCSDQSVDKQQLKTFKINSSSLSPADVTTVCRKLIDCLSPLELELTRSALTHKSIENLLRVLPKMKTLQKLDVSHSITSTAEALVLIGCLTDVHRVSSVELRPQSESFISFHPVKPERASCRLTDLTLDGAHLDRLLTVLQRGPRLSQLDLSNNQLGDEGAKCLVDSLQRLKISCFVNLSNNSLTQQGLLDVSCTLCTCTNVSSVEVSLGDEQRCLIWFCQVGGEEKALSIAESSLERDHMIRLAEVVSNCPSLSKLELRNNSLRSELIEDFVRLLESSRTASNVSVEERWITAEQAVRLLCRCLELNRNIQTIRIHQSTLLLSLKPPPLTSNCDDSSAETMETEKISVVDCGVDGLHLASLGGVIGKCRSLTDLNFSCSSLGAQEAELLASLLPALPRLTMLSVASKLMTGAVTETLWEALLQCASLRHLDLSGHPITDSAAHTLTEFLPRLQSLNLSHCVMYPAGGLQLMRVLGQCVSLEALCLDSVLLSEESRSFLAQSLRRNASIRSLRLNKIVSGGPSESSSVLELLAAMGGLTRVEEMELDGWRMSDAGTDQLIGLLPTWRELRKIIISENVITDQSGEKLLQSLRSCSRLQELHLSRNLLGDLSAARMSLVLPALTQLAVLDVSENRLGPEGAASLSRAVAGMKNLRKLHLTSVGTSQLGAVAAALEHCPLIQDVSLAWNLCGDDVMLQLAKVLPLCHKLTRIDLESNSVTPSGADALIRPLRSCPALRVIRLWKNKISPTDAHRLALSDGRLNFSST